MTSSLTRAEMRAHLRTLTVGESLTLETAMGYPTALDRVHVNLRQAADAVRGCFSVCLDKNNGQTRATSLALPNTRSPPTPARATASPYPKAPTRPPSAARPANPPHVTTLDRKRTHLHSRHQRPTLM